jgi:choline dehydrogenase-like flavoprotein
MTGSINCCGVFGSNEGLENDPDGIFLPPPKPRLHELFIRKAATSIGVPVIPSRLSMLTKKINNERGECYFCGQCNRGCSAWYADFSSSSVLVNPAVATGNVDLVVNAMAREVMTDKEGRATGVSYVNKEDMQEYQVNGKVIVLAASACESARLMLNSKSPRHPNGLSNSSDAVGRYLHDSTEHRWVDTFLNYLEEKDTMKMELGMHVYTPWWLDNKIRFPADIILNIGAEWACLPMVSVLV